MNDLSVKCVIVGATSVGKTSIVSVIVNGDIPEEYMPTLGASYELKCLEYEGHEVRVQFWDTAGQEKFQSMAPMYYRNASVALVVFALDDIQSFEKVDFWVKSIRDNTENVKIILVANKSDLDKMVSQEAAISLADRLSLEFVTVSAKSHHNIDELCNMIASAAFKTPEKMETTETAVKVSDNSDEKSKKDKGCC